MQSFSQHIRVLFSHSSSVAEAAFTSASADTGKGFGGNTRFMVRSRRGRRVADWAAFPAEDEVLFRAWTRFLVRTVYVEDGETVVEMEEL